MIKKLRIKLFGRSRKEITKDMNYLLAEISDRLDDIQESFNEITDIAKQLQGQSYKLCYMVREMNNKDERTLEEIVENIEKTTREMQEKQNG